MFFGLEFCDFQTYNVRINPRIFLFALGQAAMSNESRIQQAAAYVAKQYEAKQPIDIVVRDFVPRTIEDAYAVQASFLNLLQASQGSVGGRGTNKVRLY